ncbi:hypothetical protein Rsub_12610 [Raphidocelis subcapitata]|uniref:Uncharacterized protein n=1 Tax=Raphidocelis subcapitata TaxID=307507 RepID=A0A2V0PGJ3_9CHLO|nr:hypothetical protein Rsub_12610 [Raphidocelis subcapitata]|eukprot:GBF98964.1 hypothetical protein Rsub_12610 [Raphidocelis subcapitata]
MQWNSTKMQSLAACLAIAAAAVVFLSGVVFGRASKQPLWFTRPAQPQPSAESQAYYKALSTVPASWGNTKSSPGHSALSRLATIWRNCSQGIYLDIGTNLGVQIRKLYDPWQFPGAKVLGLYNATYGGHNRSGVCALGVEANPVHTPYLNTLNAFFARKGYQALVLTGTAASIRAGKVTFYLDHDSPVEWGASLTKGAWQRNGNTTVNKASIAALNLPAFVADIIRPLLLEIQQETGRRPPAGMKLDVEGAEYALLPALITNGGLCDLSMVYMEAHTEEFRETNGKAVNMSIAAMDEAFEHMRRANPKCTVNYTHLDDETHRLGYKIPLPL